MTWDWNIYIAVILALIAISLVILGIMTAYFGSGKSRAVGIVLLIVGFIVGILTILAGRSFLHLSGGVFNSLIIPTFFYISASVIGVAIGLLIFLGAIMKT